MTDNASDEFSVAERHESGVAESGIRRTAGSSDSLKDAFAEGLRPRELMLSRGRDALSDEQLLAIILRSGTRGCNVLELSRLLLQHFGTLYELVKSTPEELVALKLPGLNTVKALELSAALEIARRVMTKPVGNQPLVRNPEVVVQYLESLVRHTDQELFIVLPLDRKNRLIGRPVKITQGILDASLVHPREVFRVCIRMAASSLIVAHNHPSGDPTPSAEDLRITTKLAESGKIIGIPLVDHIIIGDAALYPPGYMSLRSTGAIS